MLFINDSTAIFLAANGQSGFRGEIYLCTTTDTLNSWSIVKQIGINSFYCLGDKTIFAILSDSTQSKKLVKSINGGLTWMNIQTLIDILNTTSEVESIYFTNEDVGFIVEETIARENVSYFFKSIDGGENWTIQKMNYPALNDIHFFDKNNGIGFGGWITGCHGDGCGYSGDLFFTKDGGKTWEWAFSRGMIKSAYFIDEMTGYIICNETWNEDCCYKTNDGGKTWTEVIYKNDDSIELTFMAKEVLFLNQNIGWIIGHWPGCSGAAIMGTANGGESWDIIWRKDQGSSFELNSIHSIGTEAWAVGESGMILKYSEQSQWQVQDTITDLPLNEVFFYDQQHGWITGGYYDEDNVYLKLFKTNDGGENWEDIPDFNYHINDIFFADSLHGWAVGNDTSYHCGRGGCSLYSGIMLDTHDGGYSWNIVAEGLIGPLNAIHFKNGYGWAVGGNGLVLRTEDGINWIDQKTSKIYPNKFSLSQNYPNPFNPRTKINYELPMTNEVKLSVYNLLGQKVVTLVSEKQKAGYHQVEWNASGFASGIYYYKITAGEFQDVKKMILLR